MPLTELRLLSVRNDSKPFLMRLPTKTGLSSWNFESLNFLTNGISKSGQIPSNNFSTGSASHATEGGSRGITKGVHSFKTTFSRNNWPNPNNFGDLYLEGYIVCFYRYVTYIPASPSVLEKLYSPFHAHYGVPQYLNCSLPVAILFNDKRNTIFTYIKVISLVFPIC